MKKLKVAMLGFGNAGQAFIEMLGMKHDEIKLKYDLDVKITAIVTNSRGTIVNSNGIDGMKACEEVRKSGKFHEETIGYCKMTDFQVIDEADYDVMLELTPLNIFTGQPAIDHIKHAVNRKKHVVTANKGPIAWEFNNLKKLAEDAGVGFFYETTVMDGTPIFNLVEHTLKLCKVKSIEGILNSTTNYILEELALGKDYDQVIAKGKELGFIEANPAMDIEGYDAAAKVTALLNVLMKANITPNDVNRVGIENITLDDIKKADKNGKVIKLLCKGYIQNDKVVAEVKPVELDKSDLLASVTGTTSLVAIETDLMGKLSIVEHDPEIQQTAYGVFGDLLRVIELIK